MAEVMDRTESAWTATEVMREAQAFATDTGHLLAMYSAATRGEAYAVIDEELKARLPAGEYARYLEEEQRPILQRQVLAATMAGASLEEVLDVATGRDFTGARSVAAVMHGRVEAAGLGRKEAGQTVTWAERVPEVVRPQTRALGVALAEAMDARAHELAARQAETPEPWVLTTVGPFPADGSEQLRTDWLGRVGTAASYREAARITDPNVVAGPAPQGHPELKEAHAATLRALEIESEDRMVYAMTRGQLEATVAEYERVAQAAPPEVSPQLRAERLAEADARARGAELFALGQHDAAQIHLDQADRANVRATVLEGQAEAYAAWEEAHRPERDAGERARAELDRRNAAERHRHAELEERAAEREDLDLPDSSADAERAAEAEDLDVPDFREAESAPHREAEAVTADSPAPESPQVTAGTPAESARIEDPDLARAAAELDAHQAERQAEAKERAAEDADRREERTVREASRKAAEAEADAPAAESPGAWVPGRDTPSYGSPAASAAEPAPTAEVAEAEAEL